MHGCVTNLGEFFTLSTGLN